MGRKPKQADAENNGLNLDESQDQNEGVKETRTVVLASGTLSEVQARLQKLQEKREAENKRPQKIRSAKWANGEMHIGYSISTDYGTDDIPTRKCVALPHDDLVNALGELHVHFARLCFLPEMEPNPAFKTEDTPEAIAYNAEFNIEEFFRTCHCTKFEYDDKKDNEIVKLFGYRILPNAKMVEFKAPPQRLENDSYEYEYSHELSYAIMVAIGELELYLFEDKHKVTEETGLFDADTMAEMKIKEAHK